MRPEFPSSAVVSAAEWLLLRKGRRRRLSVPVRYGFFVHPVVGLTLIDTGYTPRVTEGRRGVFLRLYAALLRLTLSPSGQLDAFLEARGLSRSDVAAVIVTHFHADHVAGLRALPAARFLASRAAVSQLEQSSDLALVRHGIFRELLPDDFAGRLTLFDDCPRVEAPLGLGLAYDLFGDGSVLALPLPGHARGHSGVLFARLDPPLLYAADAQWLRSALAPNRSGPASLIVFDDRVAGEKTAARILRFEANGGKVVLCHDPEQPA